MATLEYDISVIGTRNVESAFARIERRAALANRRLAQQGARRGAADAGSRSGAMRAGGGTAAASAEDRLRAQSEARIAKIRERSSARIAKLEQASMAATEKQRSALRAASAKRQEAHQLRMARIDEAHKSRMRLQEESSSRRMAADKQRREFQAQELLARKKLADMRRANAAAGAARTQFAGTVGAAGLGSATSLGRGAAGLATVGGAAIIGVGIAKQMATSKAAAALANKAFGIPGETRSREEIQRDLVAQSTTLGRKSGNRSGVIEAIDKYVAISGSLRGGEALAPFMMDLADATGATTEDVGRTTGQITQNIVATKDRDMTDPEQFAQTMRETQDVMRAMAGQAKIGSIEFADLAQQMGKVMSATSRFDGEVGDLANQMGAVAQLAIAGGASSPEEAMTAIMRFSDDLVQNAATFDKMAKKVGIKESFFTDKGKTKLRDPTQIMMNVLRATGGDLTKVKGIFGIRAMKAIEPFQQAYVTARKSGMTEDEALERVQTTVDTFKDAKMSEGEVADSAEFARAQAGAQLQIAFEGLTTTMGTELMPIITEMVPDLRDFMLGLKDAAPTIKNFLGFLKDNPYAGLGALIAGKVTADIAAAAIGAKVSAALTAAIAKAMGGAAAAGAAPAAAGKLGALAGYAGPAAAALAGIGGAVHEGFGLYGLLKEKGGPILGADDFSLGSAANFLMGGAVGAIGTGLGNIGTGMGFGGVLRSAAEELTPVKGASALFGEEPVGKIMGGMFGEGNLDLSRIQSSNDIRREKGQELHVPEFGKAAEQQTEAAKTNADAAQKMNEAAEAFKAFGSGLNRGFNPSPPAVK